MLATVAPRAGAWIEIKSSGVKYISMLSLLVQERGLKLKLDGLRERYGSVAPRVGAWIEIYVEKTSTIDRESLLVQEHGLKLAAWRSTMTA